MTIDLGSKDMASLMQLRQNYESAGKQRDPCYLAIIAEIDRRREGKFSVEKTVSFLQKRARVRTFVSYKSIAGRYGIEWRIARRPIVPHLDDVCRFAYGKGWPLLTAIVVNQENVATGHLEGDALVGFCRSADNLGICYSDRALFLREQQEAVFAWAQSEEVS